MDGLSSEKGAGRLPGAGPRAVLRGIGIYSPENVVTNADLFRLMDTSDEWISSRTGIRERRLVPPDSSLQPSDMGAAACRQALERAGMDPASIDAVIVTNMVPDKQFPATACYIQAKLGADKAFAFDLTAACAGFVFALNLADLYIRSGQCRRVLVVGTELSSRIVDWKDRNTAVLFGDAAGAVVLEAEAGERGILASKLKSDGRHADILYLDSPLNAPLPAVPVGGGRSAAGAAPAEERPSPAPSQAAPATLHMDGKQVFRLAVSEVSAVVEEAVQEAGFALADLDLFVMHQANVRIIGAVGEKLGLGPERVFVNVDRYGNTSSASIPLALFEAEEQGRLKPGMLVALAGVGGGLSWGCNLLRW